MAEQISKFTGFRARAPICIDAQLTKNLIYGLIDGIQDKIWIDHQNWPSSRDLMSEDSCDIDTHIDVPTIQFM